MEFDRKKWAREELRRAIEIEENSRGEKSEKDPRNLAAEDAVNALNIAEWCYETGLNSGAPRGLVCQIFNQLMQDQPLSPIQEDEDIWEWLEERRGISPGESYIKYFCKRLPTLTKLVTTDENGEEKIKYNDSGRYYCFDAFQQGRLYTGGLAEAVLNELVPIEFPYYPTGKFAIFTERFRSYPTTPDVDTIGILRMRAPDGHTIFIDRYFKLTPDGDKWIQTDGADYQSRRRKAIDIFDRQHKEKMAQEEPDGK